MGIFQLFRRSALKSTARELYFKLVEQARKPAFYRHCGAPDTVDGRFDMIVLHAFLLLHRLKREQEHSHLLAQALFDSMFANLDQNLREMGIGDQGIGPRVKAMAQAFYGRIAAYESGLDGDDKKLSEALKRNLFHGSAPQKMSVDAMIGYMRREATALDHVDLDAFLAGRLTFGPPPGESEENML